MKQGEKVAVHSSNSSSLLLQAAFAADAQSLITAIGSNYLIN